MHARSFVAFVLACAAIRVDCNILSVTGNLTTSQIRNMAASPVTLVPAPGPGKAHLVVSAYLEHLYGGSPFYNGVSTSINYGNMAYEGNGQTAAICTGPFDSTASSIQRMDVELFSQMDYYNRILLSDCDNLPLSITSDDYFYGGGSGTARYFIAYQTIPVA